MLLIFSTREVDFSLPFYKIPFLGAITCPSAAYDTIVYKALLSDPLVNYAKQYSCFPLTDEIKHNILLAQGHWLSESKKDRSKV